MEREGEAGKATMEEGEERVAEVRQVPEGGKVVEGERAPRDRIEPAGIGGKDAVGEVTLACSHTARCRRKSAEISQGDSANVVARVGLHMEGNLRQEEAQQQWEQRWAHRWGRLSQPTQRLYERQRWSPLTGHTDHYVLRKL